MKNKSNLNPMKALTVKEMVTIKGRSDKGLHLDFPADPS